MALRSFDISTTRRLAISLLSASGALLFSALNLVGAGISAGDKEYAAGISAAVSPLSVSACSGLMALICAEIAAHKDTPAEGHPHSKRNYLESAFVGLSILGLGYLVFGGFKLISAATVEI